jgi:AcrR family transcriptional regulator
MTRAGRRGGGADTRTAILLAAREEFLEHGYTAATIRAVARRAEVDAALVYHYFADKSSLYAATLALPADPREIKDASRSARRSPGVELVERFLAQWEVDPEHPGQAFVTMAQAMSSSPDAARSLKEFLAERVWAGSGDEFEAAGWCRSIVSSQLMGMAWSRYILRVEPLASASLSEVAAQVGPFLETLMLQE